MFAVTQKLRKRVGLAISVGVQRQAQLRRKYFSERSGKTAASHHSSENAAAKRPPVIIPENVKLQHRRNSPFLSKGSCRRPVISNREGNAAAKSQEFSIPERRQWQNGWNCRLARA